MTPDELRLLADEAMPLTTKERNELAAHRAVHGSDTSTPRADAYDLAGEILGEMAFDLARLCADLAEAIDAADSRKHAFEYGGRATAWRALRKTRAKLSELKPVT